MKNNLKEAREKLGLTQSQVAEKAGIPYRSYQNYELEINIPTVDIAIKIAKALKTTVEKLFGTK